MTTKAIARIAIPTPQAQLFDYVVTADQSVRPGMRVKVPFGKREVIGLVVALASKPAKVNIVLKNIAEVLDTIPIMSCDLLALQQWAADYYHQTPQEIYLQILPTLLRHGRSSQTQPCYHYALSEVGITALAENKIRGTRQQRLMQFLKTHGQQSHTKLLSEGFTKADVENLLKKSWVQQIIEEEKSSVISGIAPPPFNLTTEQQVVLQTMHKQQDFQVYLLHGVTGSGKTEIYLQKLSELISQQKQALVLLPEIGLTPQTIQRFQQRLNTSIAIYHSGLTDTERMHLWLQVLQNKVQIIIGTRSAIFLPFAQLGLIVVDESHDGSYKQQAGWRYHARDMAVRRAQIAKIPIILGTATPALESFYNAERNRYHYLQLTQRAQQQPLPSIKLIDMQQTPCEQGISVRLLEMIEAELRAGQQVMLFLNRRGYAPTVICHACSAVVECKRCDAKLIWHHRLARLKCHHCGYQTTIPKACPSCGTAELLPLGMGTERIEIFLKERFDLYRILRFDRDVIKNASHFADAYTKIINGEVDILIGTQMLAKGHHFPKLSLVAILDVDAALYSADFRAREQMGQLITQVAGRAGRGDSPGQVYLQTHFVDHPILQSLVRHDYPMFLQTLQQERRQFNLPPYSYLALLRAESLTHQVTQRFLVECKNIMQQQQGAVELLGPVAAELQRKAGYYRCQLLLRAPSRPHLQNLLQASIAAIRQLPLAKKVRWSLDVDPMEVLS